jgi:3-oxoacyl-[acyl-carrier-protein] synthase-3
MSAQILGVGSCLPTLRRTNQDFISHRFYKGIDQPFEDSNEIIIEKFKEITGIEERRYAQKEQTNSDLGIIAAQKAIAAAAIDPETLDYIIFAHNFGDVRFASNHLDMLPALASRVKHALGIANPNCVAYDMLFGCPGWIEALIQANLYIKAGAAVNCLGIGSETLSRVVDPHDRDSMIFADGAGACILSANTTNDVSGILAHATQTFTKDEAYFLNNGPSLNSKHHIHEKYIKMQGRKIYEFALTKVPAAMKIALDKSGVSIEDVKKIFIHQANEKMDEAIIDRFYRLNKAERPENIMPMNIQFNGNSSVATVPTLLDAVIRGEYPEHHLNKGDVIILASVGAGMNINAVVYRW